MKVLDPDTVIEATLEYALHLKAYTSILDTVRQDPFVATAEFRTTFNGFFRLRQRPAAWYEQYYKLMEEQKSANRSFKDLLLLLEPASGTIDVSFASKLMAAIDPSLPIWDKYVLQNLGLLKRWEKMTGKENALRIDEACRIYQEIKAWYQAFICSEDGKKCIAAFDAALPSYRDKLTAVKKSTIFFGAKGEERQLWCT